VNNLKIADVQEARRKLRPIVRRTPLDYSRTISELLRREVYLKYENLQRTGSFKIRGAYYKMCGLAHTDRGVVAASAGNHAQGVALAAAEHGLTATVVMPRQAPGSKIQATMGYGARVILAGQNYDEAYAEASRIAEESGATFIPAFDDPEIIAGQGTIGFEIIEDLPDVEAVLVPVGGGGLISGIGLVVKSLKPDTRVIGVTTVNAPAALLSRHRGKLQEVPVGRTIADGIAVKRPGTLPLELIRRYVDDIVAVEEEFIAKSLLVLLSRTKTLVEGAGAVGLAALLSDKVRDPARKLAIVLSGGNIDATTIARIIVSRKRMTSGKELEVWRRNFLH
jgi:threonine dehydratase